MGLMDRQFSLSFSLFIFFCVNSYILKTIMKKHDKNSFMFFVLTALDKILGKVFKLSSMIFGNEH